MIGVGIRAQYILAIPLAPHINAEITLPVDQHVLQRGFQNEIRQYRVGLGESGANVGRHSFRRVVFVQGEGGQQLR